MLPFSSDLMANVASTLMFLSQLQTIKTISYVAGFIWTTPHWRDILEFPLSSILGGVIGGYVASLGARFVHWILPSNLGWGISVLLLGSIVYHLLSARHRQRHEPFSLKVTFHPQTESGGTSLGISAGATAGATVPATAEESAVVPRRTRRSPHAE